MSFKNINLGDARPIPDFEEDSKSKAADASPRRLSKNAMGGFVMAILYAIIAPISSYYLMYDGRRNDLLFSVLFIASIVCFFGGLIPSLLGMSDCKTQELDGHGYGVAGFVTTVSMFGFACMIMIVMSFSQSASGEYHGPTVRRGNFEVVLNREERTAKNALLERWYWDGDVNNLVIEVPDTFSDDIVIDRIGEKKKGPRTHFFYIDVRDDTKLQKDHNVNIPAGTAVHDVDLVFTIVIGKNVKYVNLAELPTFVATNADGSVTKYWLHVRFEVSPKNRDFYAEDGKLYDSGTRQLFAAIDPSVYPDEPSSGSESGS